MTRWKGRHPTSMVLASRARESLSQGWRRRRTRGDYTGTVNTALGEPWGTGSTKVGERGYNCHVPGTSQRMQKQRLVDGEVFGTDAKRAHPSEGPSEVAASPNGGT